MEDSLSQLLLLENRQDFIYFMFLWKYDLILKLELQNIAKLSQAQAPASAGWLS